MLASRSLSTTQLVRYFNLVLPARNTKLIYIPLLDEGVPVVRPTQGESQPEGFFLVLPTVDYDPEDEAWEFLPGSCVKCVEQMHDGECILVARHLAFPSPT